MQFKWKLTTKIWENGKKPISNIKIFFRGFYLYLMLDIVASYHDIQFQGKFMIQTQWNDKKHHFAIDLGPLGPNSGRQIFFIKLVVRHCSKLSFYSIYRKTNEPSLRKWWQSCVLPVLDIRHCRKLSLYAISRKMYDPNSRKWQKTSFWDWFRPIGPTFGPPIFFSKIWLCSVTKNRYYQLLLCTPVGIYLFKVNNRNTRTRCEICQWSRSGVFIVTFENISHLVLVFLLLTLNM